jgi:hypothetical protein
VKLASNGSNLATDDSAGLTTAPTLMRLRTIRGARQRNARTRNVLAAETSPLSTKMIRHNAVELLPAAKNRKTTERTVMSGPTNAAPDRVR